MQLAPRLLAEIGVLRELVVHRRGLREAALAPAPAPVQAVERGDVRVGPEAVTPNVEARVHDRAVGHRAVRRPADMDRADIGLAFVAAAAAADRAVEVVCVAKADAVP